MDGEPRSPPYRRRLRNRRNAITETIIIGNMTLTASIGFDETGQPAEVFLSGAKDGSGMAAILDDASVVISIALQHGIPPASLAKSISRAPDARGRISAASAIGAALDLIAEFETRQHVRPTTGVCTFAPVVLSQLITPLLSQLITPVLLHGR